MAQLSVRISDDLAERVRVVAATSGRSVNAYVTAVLDAATDPDTAEDTRQRTRERLARAGLLVEVEPGPEPPPEAEVSEARRAAGRGKPLSEIVSEQRG